MEAVDNDLTIPIPSSDHLRMEDCRRLTGPGLLWNHAGAVVDVAFDGFDPARVVKLWLSHSRRVLDAAGWHGEQSMARLFDGGANLAVSAPMDQLYAATNLAETAWHFCASELLGSQPGDFGRMIADLTPVMAREANPPLVALINASAARGIDTLCDDEALSLGHGTGSQTWPVTALPTPDEVDWSRLRNVPVAVITGTNGKTTTTRLCAAIAKAAGRVSGLTSTELVRVGDDVLDRGDFSGPNGGRLLLRDRRLEMGFLEVARGGILRRGLPLRRAQVAAVLNVAADHLGQYGVNTVAELATVKFSVHRALTETGVLVLNADDAFVVTEAARTPGKKCWFSLDPNTPQIRDACAAGTPCAWLDGAALVLFDGVRPIPVIEVSDIPIAMGGAARYNIENALAAVCVSRALGIDERSIKTGISGFQSDPIDNPGRCNEFSYRGARVFVDFAHNPHSIAAVTSAMAAVPAKRRFIMLSLAGDRSDQDIRDLATGAFAFNPDIVAAAELPDYLRGRELGEVTRLIKEACIGHGMADDNVLIVPSPSAGAAAILNLLTPGDLALLLVHSERDKIFRMLADDDGRNLRAS